MLEEESKILPLSCCQDRLRTEWNLQNQSDKCGLVLSSDLIHTGRLALMHGIQTALRHQSKLWLSPFLSVPTICTHIQQDVFFLFSFYCRSRKRNIKHPDEHHPPHAGDLLRHAANYCVPLKAATDSDNGSSAYLFFQMKVNCTEIYFG